MGHRENSSFDKRVGRIESKKGLFYGMLSGEILGHFSREGALGAGGARKTGMLVGHLSPLPAVDVMRPSFN